MGALPHSSDTGPPPVVRAVIGLLLGLAAGAAAAFLTPRRPEPAAPAGDPEDESPPRP
ncbi:MAG TPA: hypothetical protein VM324_15600 [Egibacteraceae bacterium]|nr:hypothetical protein [Egibacteraceae bacterium]